MFLSCHLRIQETINENLGHPTDRTLELAVDSYREFAAQYFEEYETALHELTTERYHHSIGTCFPFLGMIG